MNKNCYVCMSLVLMSLMGICFASCSGGDGDGGGSGGGEWYTNILRTSFHEDNLYVQERIDQLFDSNGRYGGSIKMPNGMVSNGPAGNGEIEVFHVASNALELYYGHLYKYGSSGTSGKTLLYRITGSALGDVGYYASLPQSFSYTREGDVITATHDGAQLKLTVTSTALLGNGGDRWERFELGRTYNDDFKPIDVSELIDDAKTISMSATVVGDPTFHKASFKCTFGTSKNGKTYKRVFAFSKNKADLEDADLLGSRYYKFTGGNSVHNPPSYTSTLNTASMQGANQYFEDGDLRFADEGTADLTNFTAVYDELGVTIYYCPVISVINEVAIVGDINSVTMRQLKQTSGFVDLGLSCQWLATNNNASSPWDFGQSIPLFDKNVSDGGRIPTKEEVLELNKCQLETIDNGILVTGLNGNELFIPYRDTKDNKITGYGTSSSQYSDLFDRDVLFNFDSSKGKFTTFTSTSITRHSSAYVRPVKGGSGGGGGNNDDPVVDPVVDDNVIANSKDLNNYLNKPLGYINIDPKTADYSSMSRALLNELQSISEAEADTYRSLIVTTPYHPSLKKLTYRDLTFFGFSFDQYYTGKFPYIYSYSFKKTTSELPDPYPVLDQIVKDFNYLGIPISYSKTTQGYTEASGEIDVGNLQYYICVIDDYDLEMKDVWVFAIVVRRRK